MIETRFFPRVDNRKVADILEGDIDAIRNAIIARGDTMTIGRVTEVDVTGSNSFIHSGGTTTVKASLVASTIEANGGVLDFAGAITHGDGVGALDIGAKGMLEFGSSVDTSHTVHFNAGGEMLELGDPKAFKGVIEGFSPGDEITLVSQTINETSSVGSGDSRS
jgi:hypothetical protein